MAGWVLTHLVHPLVERVLSAWRGRDSPDRLVLAELIEHDLSLVHSNLCRLVNERSRPRD